MRPSGRRAFAAVAVAAAACSAHGARSAAPVPATAPASQSRQPFTPQLLARGDSLFHASSCIQCHGPTGKGSPHGPSLTVGVWAQTDGSYDDIIRIITVGVPEDKIIGPTYPEPMPARGGDTPPLTDEQIRALAAYVYSLSHR